MGRRTPRQRAIGGGVYVILVTGLAAVARLAKDAESTADYGLLCAILIGSIASAVLLHRLVAKHGDEIGEARFAASQLSGMRSDRNGN